MRGIWFSAAFCVATAFGLGLALAQHDAHQHGHKGQGATATETRILVELPPELARHTLANMRDHVLALQAVSEALSRGQTDRAARVAEERLGMSSLGLHGAHEVARYMPQGMQDAGTAMHRAASRLAIAAQTAGATGDLKPAFGALADVLAACAGCHAGYRLQ